MANQYTAGAYAGVKPIQEDFGDDALKAYEITMKNNAQKIALRRQRTEEAKAAQDRLNTYFKDMDEYAAKALNIQPMDFDRGLTDHMVESHRKQIVDAMRIIQDPTKTDAEKIMARSRVRTLSDNALNYVNDRKSMMDLLKDMNNVDTEDGWDSVLSVPVCDSVNRALLSAGEKGTKRNEDGSISAGDYMVQKMGDRGTIITLKTADVLGEDISGTYSEIAAKLKGKMFKTVDLQKTLWGLSDKAVEARISEYYRNNKQGLIEIVKTNNWGEMKNNLENYFDSLFPDAGELSKQPVQIRKAVAQGFAGREAVKKYFVNMGLSKAKDLTDLKLKDDMAYIAELKANAKGKGQDSATDPEEVLRQIQSFAQGDDNAINYFVGRKTNLNAPGAKAGDAKIESVEVKDGKIKLTVGGDYEKGFGSNQSKTYTFDTNNPEDQDVLVNALVDSYNQDKTTKQKVEVSQLRGLYDSSVPMINRGETKIPDVFEKYLKVIDEKLKDKNQLTTSEIKPIVMDLREKLHNVGYDMDINGSWFGKWGDMEITINDTRGDKSKEVKKIKTDSGKILANDLRDFVTDVLGRNDVSKNDSWLLSNKKPGGQTAGNSGTVKQTQEVSAQKQEPVKQGNETAKQEQKKESEFKIGSNVRLKIGEIIKEGGNDDIQKKKITDYMRKLGYGDEFINGFLNKIF